MTEKQAGLSAMAMAFARAHHATYDSPKIFDDFLASALFTPEELAQTSQTWAGLLKYIDPGLAAANPDPADALAWVLRLFNGPITLPRSRYAEDSLEDAIHGESVTKSGSATKPGVSQYVILGAGFDTYAYRRAVRSPELPGRLQIFELDHPATQAIKRERVAAAGWSHPENLHFVPVDFTRESLADALGHSAYDPSRPGFFSWLGVSYYLTRAVVFDTLRGIASIAAQGSAIVFDYMDTDAFIPEKAGKHMQLMQGMAVQLGEPMKAGFNPLALGDDLERLGLRLEENLDPAAIEARYLTGAQGYHAVEHLHLARAVVA